MTYVVFSQPEELNRALQMCVNGETVRCNIQVTGIRKWCAEYASARPVVDQLESTVGHIVGEWCHVISHLYYMQAWWCIYYLRSV